jgi:hypothetical protein
MSEWGNDLAADTKKRRSVSKRLPVQLYIVKYSSFQVYSFFFGLHIRKVTGHVFHDCRQGMVYCKKRLRQEKSPVIVPAWFAMHEFDL